MKQELQDLGRDEWSQRLEISNPWARSWFTDEEGASASGLSPRGLRTLQARGLIRAVVAKRNKGAQIRLWGADDILKAALIDGLSRFAGFATPTAISLLQLVPVDVLDDLCGQTASYIADMSEDPDSLISDHGWCLPGSKRLLYSEGDISLIIIDRRVVFIAGRFPELLEDAEPGTDVQPIGLVRDLYSRDPVMRQIAQNPSSDVLARLYSLYEHPISANIFNLEIALRWRIARSLGLNVTR